MPHRSSPVRKSNTTGRLEPVVNCSGQGLSMRHSHASDLRRCEARPVQSDNQHTFSIAARLASSVRRTSPDNWR